MFCIATVVHGRKILRLTRWCVTKAQALEDLDPLFLVGDWFYLRDC